MRIAVPMITMLVAGLAFGIGGSTLLWSGMHRRASEQTRQALALVEENQQGWRSCLEIVKRR